MKEAINKEDFERIVKESNSKSDIAKKLGFKFFNGKVTKKIDSLLSHWSISIDHFELGKKNRKYEIITKICPICKKEFETQLGFCREKTTCSIACSNSFQPKQSSDESKKKTSDSLKLAIAEGRHKIWIVRYKATRSYPERYIESILEEELGIIKNKNYIPEFKQGRWFIDFAFFDKKIALEIDGKQHEYPERKASDIEKDKFLVDQGWSVNRIKWKGVKTKDDREAIISTLKQILKL